MAALKGSVPNPHRVAKLVVENASVVAQGCQAQFKRLHLQFISGDVVLEGHSLLVFFSYVGYKFASQVYVLLIHLYLVVYLVEVEILSQGDEAYLLPG